MTATVTTAMKITTSMLDMRHIARRLLRRWPAAGFVSPVPTVVNDEAVIARPAAANHFRPTSNNPYRHRRTIASLAGDMLADAERLGKIARAYIDKGVVAAGGTIATAEERVVAELEKIKSVFEDVGPFMDKIEDFRDRLERRIRTTVHYMDVMGEGSAERIARLIEGLSALDSDEVWAPSGFYGGQPPDLASLPPGCSFAPFMTAPRRLGWGWG